MKVRAVYTVSRAARRVLEAWDGGKPLNHEMDDLRFALRVERQRGAERVSDMRERRREASDAR